MSTGSPTKLIKKNTMNDIKSITKKLCIKRLTMKLKIVFPFAMWPVAMMQQAIHNITLLAN
jgi:hypothetical protein